MCVTVLKKWYLFVGVLVIFVSGVVRGEVVVEKEIAYAPLPECRLDVKAPVGVTGFPTVVWFHGGGLTGGRRHCYR